MALLVRAGQSTRVGCRSGRRALAVVARGSTEDRTLAPRSPRSFPPWRGARSVPLSRNVQCGSRADSESLFLGLGNGAFCGQHGWRVPEAAISIDKDVGVGFAQDADVWGGVGLFVAERAAIPVQGASSVRAHAAQVRIGQQVGQLRGVCGRHASGTQTGRAKESEVGGGDALELCGGTVHTRDSCER